MSNLHVRLQTSFWGHPKTLKLRARIGDAAYWLPPRLWSFAAEHCPDGDLSEYSAEDLMMLMQCSSICNGNAQAMLQALKETGFIGDDNRVHNWEKWAGYHKTFSDRARNAANARWAKNGHEPPESTPRFVRPTLEEVKLLATKAGLPEREAEKFFNFYEGKGWKVGKNPMKSVAHAVGGWKMRWEEENKPPQSNRPKFLP